MQPAEKEYLLRRSSIISLLERKRLYDHFKLSFPQAYDKGSAYCTGARRISEARRMSAFFETSAQAAEIR